MSDPRPKSILPGKYLHIKSGNFYEVIGVALHSESSEQIVIYKPLYESNFKLFARPYDMFIEKVEIGGEDLPRFQKVDD